MVEAIATKLGEQWSQPTSSRNDLQELIKTLLSSENALSRRNLLRDLDSKQLYELCFLGDIDTAIMPLRTKSIYPTREAMIEGLLEHDRGFSEVRNVKAIVAAWKQQKSSVADGATDESCAADVLVKTLPHFNSASIQEMWNDIEKTDFPGSLEDDRPPKNLGSKQHGRLKASQWRTTCCFTMLVTLGRLWGHAAVTENERMWLINFLHLVALVRIAYNYSITTEDIQAFRYHSVQYVEGLRSYHPSSIKPCHHFLLHIPYLMERFGPIRNWWAFPFERFNGQIQRLSTNHKVGQTEKTFLTQWLRSSRVHALLRGHTSLASLAQLASTTFGPNSHLPGDSVIVDESIGISNIQQRMSHETQLAISMQGLPISHDSNVLSLYKLTVSGRRLELYKSSQKNGFVEFPLIPNDGRIFWPVGYIHEIIQVQQGDKQLSHFACIAQCRDAEERFLDNSKDLGARLCGRSVLKYVVVPAGHLRHVVRYPWSSTTQLVISTHNHKDPC